MKVLIKSITRTRWIDGCYLHTLTLFIFADGSISYNWETPHTISSGFSESEYLKKLKYIRSGKTTEEGYEEPYQVTLTKYKNGKPVQTINM